MKTAQNQKPMTKLIPKRKCSQLSFPRKEAANYPRGIFFFHLVPRALLWIFRRLRFSSITDLSSFESELVGDAQDPSEVIPQIFKDLSQKITKEIKTARDTRLFEKAQAQPIVPPSELDFPHLPLKSKEPAMKEKEVYVHGLRAKLTNPDTLLQLLRSKPLLRNLPLRYPSYRVKVKAYNIHKVSSQ